MQSRLQTLEPSLPTFKCDDYDSSLLLSIYAYVQVCSMHGMHEQWPSRVELTERELQAIGRKCAQLA